MQRFWYTRLLTRADQGLLEELFQGASSKEAKVLDDDRQEEMRHNWQQKDLVELEEMDEGADDAAAAGWQESKEILRQALEAEQQDEAKKTAWRKLMNLLMQLRKACNHPYLLPHAEPDPYYLGEHIVHASGKFILLDKIIKELVMKRKDKILIFSGFTRMLDCCEDLLALRGAGEHFKYTRLDGGTARARRNLGIRMFNQDGSDYRVMLISTRAGGLGINLTSASTVIMLDQDWNPQIMLQAEARAHRIGQDKPVTIYKLCTQGTVEEQMMGRIQKKLYLSAKVTESMRDVHTSAKFKKGPGGRLIEVDNEMPQLDTSQLLSLVRRGAQALAHPDIDVSEMLNWDWDTMLEKCKDKPADIHVSKNMSTPEDAQVKEEEEKNWLSQMELVESHVFQGKKYVKAKEIASYGNISEEWARKQRRIGKNTTVIVDGFAVNKESMLCGDWEAVSTFAGKDPRLSEAKREKRPSIVNQEVIDFIVLHFIGCNANEPQQCQCCWDGGSLILCSGCPRSYHHQCLDRDFKKKSSAKLGFSCPQHQCFDCQQKTSDAGGMIFRCRWCERGYCEDCLDWDQTELIGEKLKEYEMLGFPSISQAFYISCPSCTDHRKNDEEARDFWDRQAKNIDEQYDQFLLQKQEDVKTESPLFSCGDSLTDATTLEDSAVNTPLVELEDLMASSAKKKRKAAPAAFRATPTKRSKRLTS